MSFFCHPQRRAVTLAWLIGSLLGGASLPAAGEGAGPATVPGLARCGLLATTSVKIAVKDAQGRIRAEARPGIEVLHSAAWSPNDDVRAGAGEFAILLAVGRLLETHALAGLVGVGNQHGRFSPTAEQAFTRAVSLGLPVVKLANRGRLTTDTDNLFIEAGPLTETEVTSLLGECLLTLGALPPARNPLQPTPAELAAIKTQVARYQLVFDARSAQGVLASR